MGGMNDEEEAGKREKRKKRKGREPKGKRERKRRRYFSRAREVFKVKEFSCRVSLVFC